MTDLTKKELVSNLYDAFADKVAAEDKELKELHKYLTPAEQHDNLVIDITKAVKDAGWQVSPGILDALCKGGAELMTMDLDEEIIVPPSPEVPAEPPAHEPPAPVAEEQPQPQPGPAGVDVGTLSAGGTQVEQPATSAAGAAAGEAATAPNPN